MKTDTSQIDIVILANLKTQNQTMNVNLINLQETAVVILSLLPRDVGNNREYGIRISSS